MRKLTLLPILALAALAACNTVEGAGNDLSAAGTAISQESREVQAR
ncbi:lipoprotein [Falsirhodobacter sp. 20TX0035]|nr:lipoprotein [Falsirhodobacter sp. 20TX0035]MDB6453467.1 lipoprotein [Falsirhodobacter sp. 20TX0035]